MILSRLFHSRGGMEKEGEDEEKTIEEANNSVDEMMSDKEDERIRGTIAEWSDRVQYTDEGSSDPSNSQMVTFEDHDVSDNEMEDEKVLELLRRNSGVRSEVAERKKFPYLNISEGMVLQFQEDKDTRTETEQTDEVFHSLNDNNKIADLGEVNLNSSEEIPEGINSSSVSTGDSEDSSSNPDHEFNLSRYYFDGSLPVLVPVEESETHQDESSVSRDENQMPLLCPKQTEQQPTSWRNCCGLLELLRAADP